MKQTIEDVVIQSVFNDISTHLKEIKLLFPNGWEATVIVRDPKDFEASMIVTSEKDLISLANCIRDYHARHLPLEGATEN